MRCVLPHRHVRYSLHVQRMRCMLPRQHVRQPGGRFQARVRGLQHLHQSGDPVQHMRCVLPRRHVRQPGGRFQARVRGLQRLLQPGNPLPGRLDGGLSCRRSQLPDRLRGHTSRARAPTALQLAPARVWTRLRADVRCSRSKCDDCRFQIGPALARGGFARGGRRYRIV